MCEIGFFGRGDVVVHPVVVVLVVVVVLCATAA